ncbi:hypothetical protein IFM89_004485 [Coptis chinensis]|uniref:Uncharacterized protein n=1 Tax=Coptis chinensis TaxID=261450 RepID=A0A835GYR7_9MAGN|nr:hypothetical protein IFM89_004485 [Coptis chinensis]
MAFVISNLSASPLFQPNKSSSLVQKPIFSFPLTKLETPPKGGLQDKGGLLSSVVEKKDVNKQERNDFYVNLGLAVRTLREDMPLLFSKDLNYSIYRDDITFIDPLNTFTGMEKYKLIFWALRFHGRILFRDISLEVFRIWQPSENVILIRWNLRGVPRVPWEAKGQFQGTSKYKLDRNGKIYEHKVDNLAFNFPQSLRPAASVLDLVTACPTSPNPTFFWGPADLKSSSWLLFYRAVRETLDSEAYLPGKERLIACS